MRKTLLRVSQAHGGKFIAKMAEAESEVSDSPVPVKQLKLCQKTHIGAAKYKCAFNSEWCISYPIKAVKNDKNSFFYPVWEIIVLYTSRH